SDQGLSWIRHLFLLVRRYDGSSLATIIDQPTIDRDREQECDEPQSRCPRDRLPQAHIGRLRRRRRAPANPFRRGRSPVRGAGLAPSGRVPPPTRRVTGHRSSWARRRASRIAAAPPRMSRPPAARPVSSAPVRGIESPPEPPASPESVPPPDSS